MGITFGSSITGRAVENRQGAKQGAVLISGLAGNLFLASISLAISITVSEIVVRHLAPQQLIIKRPDLWQPIDSLGWTHRPEVHTTINTGERAVSVITDRDGFRIGHGGRVEADRTILLLGDSFMEALQVEYEQSFAGLLEARLAERFGEPVAVRNAGVSSWDPPHYLIRAGSALQNETFDLVLVMLYLGNDVVTNRVERYQPRRFSDIHRLRVPKEISRSEMVDAVLYPINDFLEVRSHFFIFLKTRAEAIRMRLGLAAVDFPTELLLSESASTRWDITAEICRDIAKLANEHDASVLFAFIPAPFQVDRQEFELAVKGLGVDPEAVDLDQPNRLLGAAFRARELPLVDVLDVFREAHAAGKQLYGRVDRHLSPEGHAVLENALESRVYELMSPTKALF